jgi:flagellar protein FliO/FliZ
VRRARDRQIGAPREGKAEVMSESVIYAISLILLIGVCGLGFWFARQSLGLGGMPLFTPKPRRLGVVEATAIDGRRRLLLIRRDNVEHLIMTGGPVDVIIETGISAVARPAVISLDRPANGALNGREPQLDDDDVPLVLSHEAN